MNNYRDDKLKKLFQHLPLEEPSGEFETALMHNINQLATRKRRREARIYWASLAGICLLLILLTALTLHLIGFTLPNFQEMNLLADIANSNHGVIYLSVAISSIALFLISFILRIRLYSGENNIGYK